jgi:orotate phosphoribosyltransferase
MEERMTLAREIDRIARLRGTFRLRSGAVSDTYFDKYRFESDPTLLRRIAEAMVPLVPEDTEILLGLEMGGIPVVTVLSQLTGLPAGFVRKKAKEHGTCRYAEGPDLAGRRCVFVEDVVSSGGAILDAARKLEADGIPVVTALCVIDRETGGRAALEEHGIELRALLTLGEIGRARLDVSAERAALPGHRQTMSEDARFELEALRRRIDELDVQLLDVLQARFAVTARVGALKRRAMLPPRDPEREGDQRERARALARDRGLDESLVLDVLDRVLLQVVQDHERVLSK